MHKILLFFLLSCFFSTNAQQDLRKSYYPLINKAELAISVGEYGAALTLYDEAFRNLSKPFPRDIYNAFACKLFLNDFDGGKIYLYKLAQNGIKSSSLESKEVFEIMGNQEKWFQFKPTYEEFFRQKNLVEDFKEEFAQLEDLRKRLFDIDMRKFEAVKKEGTDEVYFVKKIDYWKYQNSKENVKLYSKEETADDYKLAEIEEKDLYFEAKIILDKLLTNRGFRNENFDEVDQFVHPQDPIFTYLSVFDYNVNDLEIIDGVPVLVQKEWISPDDIKSFHQKLSDAVKNGSLHPSLAAKESFMMHSFNHVKVSFFKVILENNSDCPTEFDEYGSYCFYKKNELNKDEKVEYKLMQKEFGIESLEDKYQKEVFAASKNKYFIFFTNSTYEESTVPNCDVAQKLMEGAQIVDNN